MTITQAEYEFWVDVARNVVSGKWPPEAERGMAVALLHAHEQRRTLCNEVKRLGAENERLRAALKAQQTAEESQANCPECDGIGDWAECEVCSENFGIAIDLRHSALAAGEKG